MRSHGEGGDSRVKTNLLVSLTVLLESDDGPFVSAREVHGSTALDVSDDVFSRLDERHIESEGKAKTDGRYPSNEGRLIYENQTTTLNQTVTTDVMRLESPHHSM